MSSKIRIMPQEEADAGFGLLKDIIEMAKNPKAIDEAYERRRKAVQLSEEEISKAEEARSLMANAEALKIDIKKREDALQNAIKTHQDDVIISQEQLHKEESRLEQLEIKLGIISEEQTSIQKMNNEAKTINENRAKEIEDIHKERSSEHEKKVLSQKIIDEAQKKENERLTTWENKLKAKAKRLALEATSE